MEPIANFLHIFYEENSINCWVEHGVLVLLEICARFENSGISKSKQQGAHEKYPYTSNSLGLDCGEYGVKNIIPDPFLEFFLTTLKGGIQTCTGPLLHELFVDRDRDVFHVRQGRIQGRHPSARSYGSA
ncbi:hypothetical protein RF11_03371 [Thelohanellus kitauei]|uniref:Uncharacterized protein n=1 Tax=Thelohanellus kitauei TaxID=669202 RepID=A0A0C2N5K7_THEKT|nr:hypothetical protein RF11_03371 [Thelohanellus kitauei]